MKKFQFSLETLLRVRNQEEGIMKRNFAEALARQIEKSSFIGALDDEISEVKSELSGAIEGTIEVRKLINYQKYFSGQSLRKSKAVGELKDLEKKTDSKRQELIEARKKKRVVEILKEKHHKRYLLEVSRQEQRDLDDIVSVREARKAMVKDKNVDRRADAGASEVAE